MNARLVLLFDIDGTLLTCGGAGRRAMQRAFHEETGSGEHVAFGFGGMTDKAIAREGLTRASRSTKAESIDKLLTLYLRFLDEELHQDKAHATPGFRVLPGVHALLDALKPHQDDARVALGLGTGNLIEGAQRKLEHGDLWHRFAFGGYATDHEDRAALLEAGAARGRALLHDAHAKVIVIGDTPRDIDAAKRIGAPCLAVATGHASLSELQAHGANDAASTLEEVSVERLFALAR
jgi:phosphoglycolate phosphatase-like HAD superfamily hydrolase